MWYIGSRETKGYNDRSYLKRPTISQNQYGFNQEQNTVEGKDPYNLYQLSGIEILVVVDRLTFCLLFVGLS